MTDPTPPPPPTPRPTPSNDSSRARLLLVAGAVAVILVITAIAILVPSGGEDDRKAAPAPAACGEVVTRPTDRNQQHINEPTPITYGDAPPSFGEHRPEFTPFGRPFYGADRPEVGQLVHTMEHGYTVAWYDEELAEDAEAMAELEEIATDYQADRERFVAAPWRDEDGASFPEGTHLALTRWSADPDDPADQTLHRGNWMYCSGVDAEAIDDFFETWPNAESPEPGIF